MHVDVGLVVDRGREDAGAPDWNGRVVGDNPCVDPTRCFHAERKRRHVQQKYVLLFTGQHRALQGRAHRDSLVGVDGARALLAEEIRDQFLNAWHSGLPTDQDHLVEVAGLPARILQDLLAQGDGSTDDFFR